MPQPTWVYSSSNGHPLLDNAPWKRAHGTSNWFHQLENDLYCELLWPLQSQDINPTDHPGMWLNKRLAAWMYSWQICSDCETLSWQSWPESLRNESSTLMNAYGGSCLIIVIYSVNNHNLLPISSKCYWCNIHHDLPLVKKHLHLSLYETVNLCR